jgi:hypothetical protein
MQVNVMKAALPATLLMLAACESTTPDRRPVSVSFSTQSAAALAIAGERAPNFDVTVTIGANTLVITKAQLVVRSIKLKKTETLECSDDDGIDDDCDEIKLGPMLVDLPLTANGVTSVTATIPEGTYREVSFKIHKPDDDNAEDLAFIAANPTFERTSIRVEGTYNGQAFVYTSDVSERMEVEFESPVTINADDQNVTVQLDLSSWFEVGGQIVNPNTANKGGANENAVRDNIRASMRALEDDDRNGR